MQLSIVSALFTSVLAHGVSAPFPSSNILFFPCNAISNIPAASLKFAKIFVVIANLFIITNACLQMQLARMRALIGQFLSCCRSYRPHWISKNKCGGIQDAFIVNLAGDKTNWLDILHPGANGLFLRVAK